jgi:hypothetical protein
LDNPGIESENPRETCGITEGIEGIEKKRIE